ncbi:MAG TPA: hypothetical protein VGR47_00520 [Terracidiphilus sp.]|nr:hypothetical protein [Terracidiphilus sp.]
MNRFVSVLVVSVFFGANLPAQNTPATHAPDYRAPFFIAPLYFSSKAEAPFMAIAKTHVVRIMPDGSTVTSENQRVVARDTEGRIFQERRTFVPVPNPDNRQSMVRSQEYIDPLAHTLYLCNPYAKVCNLFPYVTRPEAADRPVGVQPGGKTYLTRENLGSDLIGGQVVLHTRETLTVYAETIGNTKNIIRTEDYWYSPQLGINVRVQRQDPRDGEQTLWLTGLTLSAPDPAVFRVPQGYRIVDHRNPQRPAPANGAQ